MISEVKGKKSYVRKTRKQVGLSKAVVTEKWKDDSWTEHDTGHNRGSNWSHQSSNNSSQGSRKTSQQCKTNTYSTEIGQSSFERATFDWKATDKYHGLCNFEIEVNKIFMTNNYNFQDSDRVPLILNWLGCENLRHWTMWKRKNTKQALGYSKHLETTPNTNITIW